MTTEPRAQATRKLPGALMAAINVGIIFHLFALGALVLSVQAGPWSVRYLNTPSSSLAPPFASSIAQYTTPYYLQPLCLANDYHFNSNLTDLPTIRLELAGQPRHRNVQFPDAQSNMWVRHRQRLLVAGTGNDQPYQAPMAEGVPAADQKIPEITFFSHPFEAVQHKLNMMRDKDFKTKADFLRELAHVLTPDEMDRYQEVILSAVEGPQSDYRLTDKTIASLSHPDAQVKSMNLYQLQVNRMPKVQVFTPAPAALILVRSFARYLERQRGEAVELVRLFRNPIGPAVMFPSPLDPGKMLIDAPTYGLETIANNFGDGRPRAWSPK